MAVMDTKTLYLALRKENPMSGAAWALRLVRNALEAFAAGFRLRYRGDALVAVLGGRVFYTSNWPAWTQGGWNYTCAVVLANALFEVRNQTEWPHPGGVGTSFNHGSASYELGRLHKLAGKKDRVDSRGWGRRYTEERALLAEILSSVDAAVAALDGGVL